MANILWYSEIMELILEKKNKLQTNIFLLFLSYFAILNEDTIKKHTLI